jgi:hypothetical protein
MEENHMEEQDFVQRKERAIARMNARIGFIYQVARSRTTGLYDHDSTGAGYQADIDDARRHNAKVSQSSHRNARTVEEFISALRKTTSPDEVWKLVLKELFFISHSKTPRVYPVNGGLNWPAIHGVVANLGVLNDEVTRLTTGCMQDIYQEFWV